MKGFAMCEIAQVTMLATDRPTTHNHWKAAHEPGHDQLTVRQGYSCAHARK
jgi:hypothetical protein